VHGASTSTRRSCRFCGATEKLTREHWLPQWTRALVDDGPPAPYVRAEEEQIEHIWDAPLGSMTVKQVCEGCNAGWMSQLEEQARPLLTPMLRGQVRTFSAAEQLMLATWAAKTIYAADLTRPDPVAPDENRKWVREHQVPPSGTTVLVARYGGRRYPLYTAGGTKTLEISAAGGPPQPWRTYVLSVSAGPVVLQIFGHAIANVVEFRPTGWKRDFAHVLWPDPAPLTWPLPRALGDDGLRRFVHDI
jgi:hypothetical protein